MSEYRDRSHHTVSLPKELVDEVKEYIQSGKVTGYRNHTEFIIEAVRIRMQSLKQPISNDSIRKLVDLFKDVKNDHH